MSFPTGFVEGAKGSGKPFVQNGACEYSVATARHVARICTSPAMFDQPGGHEVRLQNDRITTRLWSLQLYTGVLKVRREESDVAKRHGG